MGRKLGRYDRRSDRRGFVRVTFSHAWTADKAWIGVAVGKNASRIAVASGTIVPVHNQLRYVHRRPERWYSNP